MPEIDESRLAEWNASALGTQHRTVPVTVAGLLGALDRVLDVSGEPAGDAAALPLTMLADGPADRLTATVPSLDPGGWRVEWRVLSTDGHVVSGRFSFRVAR